MLFHGVAKTFSMAQEQIRQLARDFVSHLKEKYNLPVEKALLYGSHAQNRPHQWSDIDVCVISPLFRDEDAISYLWQRRRKEDVKNLSAPIGFSPEDFAATPQSPLIHSIKESGQKLEL